MSEAVLAAQTAPAPPPTARARLAPGEHRARRARVRRTCGWSALGAAGAAAGPDRREARSSSRTYRLADALALERELGIGHALAQILVRRGLGEPAAARAFLEAGEAHDPGAFAGIDRVAGGDPALTSGPAGGSPSTATTTSTACAPPRSWSARCARWAPTSAGFCPSRIDDGYGLSARSIERLAERGTTLILTVDCGITAVEEAAVARAAGVDLVITDHHAPRADGDASRLPDPAPGGVRLPVPAAVRHRRRLQARAGARGADRRRGPRAGGAGHGRRPGAADGREPAAGARGAARSWRPPPSPGCAR